MTFKSNQKAIPASPKMFGLELTSGVRGAVPTSPAGLTINQQDFKKALERLEMKLPKILAARVAAFETLIKHIKHNDNVVIAVDSLVYRLSEVDPTNATVEIEIIHNNALIASKCITIDGFLAKAAAISQKWQNPAIYVKNNTWYVGDFALHIEESGAYYEDIGGSRRRFNNLVVATHNFRGVGYAPEELALLDSVSSLYCWLSMYMPVMAHSGARILDFGNFVRKLPMDGREDCTFDQKEMTDFAQNLWKTTVWAEEAIPTGQDKELYIPKSLKSVDLVEPLHKMGLTPVIKGSVDFVPLQLGAVKVDPEQHNGKGLCVLSHKTSKAMKRITMAWGVVCQVLGQQPSRFRQDWQRFGERYITTVAILPSHVAAPGVAWDFGSGLTIANPKWAVAYRGELYDRNLPVAKLVGLYWEEAVEANGWFVAYANYDRPVVKGEPIAWINCDGYQVPVKAHCSGQLELIRWRIDCSYAHLQQKNLIVEVCIIQHQTSWKARSGAFKAMMVKRSPSMILGEHNAKIAFPKDTIKTFDQVVDLLEICAETFSRMPEGSKYRQALAKANRLVGEESDTCLVFNAKLAIGGAYKELLELLEDWKRPVTTKELVCGDTAEFLRRFLTLHTAYDGWVADGDGWRKDELIIRLVEEGGNTYLYQTGLGYISTPEMPLYMGQKAEYTPVADCVSVGTVLPSVLLDLDEKLGFELYEKHAKDAVEYATNMLAAANRKPCGGTPVALDIESIQGLSPSELFVAACENGDYITLEKGKPAERQYPIRLIKKFLGGYNYGTEYTLARVLGDYMYATLWDQKEGRDIRLARLAENAERLLKSVTVISRLRKVVANCVPALNAKTVALPEVPMSEVWIKYSTNPDSVYQQFVDMYGEIPEVVGVYRAPMIHSSFYKVVVKHDDLMDEYVVAMAWLASYYDQGDHDGDGRTFYAVDGAMVEIASIDGVLKYVEQCLGVNLLSMEGLVNGPKDLFIDHYEWLTNTQITAKRGIKSKNFVTEAEFLAFTKGSYELFTIGVGQAYNMSNYPLVVKKLEEGQTTVNILRDIPAEHFYGAQTLYEKMLGGWSKDLYEIFLWMNNPPGDIPQEAFANEGFRLSYAESWRDFCIIAKEGFAINQGKGNLKLGRDALLSTAWVAFSLFRAGEVEKEARIAIDLESNTSLVAHILRQAYAIEKEAAKLVPIPRKDRKERSFNTDGLNTEQAAVLHLVLGEGRSVDLNGRAGTGKTYTLNRLIKNAKDIGYKVLVAAPTGQAALLYAEHGGTTCARLFGYGAKAEVIEIGGIEFGQIVAKVRPKFVGKVLIIIDEKSMLSSEELRLAYEIVKAARSGQPCQWVLAGDYGQFPPVKGNYAFKGCVRHGVAYGPVVDEAGMVNHSLTQVVRQKDPVFQEALDWAYWGIALHPALLERLVEAPDSADHYYYNNHNVVVENNKYVTEFLANHPNAARKTYQAVTKNISDADLRLLLPVQTTMTIAVGMAFTVTKNVTAGGSIKVANGEQVTVKVLRESSIVVTKSNGEEVTLEMVEHDLATDEPNKVFRQLPGYVGPALSLYKCQGKTIDKPSCFELWQQFNGSDKVKLNLANALYVAASRTTELKYLYFGGNEKLLRGSFGADPEVIKYLLGGRRPLWAVNRMENHIVRLTHTDSEWVYFTQSNIQNGKSVEVRTDYQVSTAQVLVSGEWIEVDTDDLVREYHDLIQIYQQDWR